MAEISERRMAMMVDLEKPMPLNSPAAVCLIAARPTPPQPASIERRPRTLPKRLSKEEAEQLATTYWNHVATPVTMFGEGGGIEEGGVTVVIPGRAWVVPLLSAEECDATIAAGEAFGVIPALLASGAVGLRTSKRTASYCNVELSALVGSRLCSALLDMVEETAPHTAVRGLHPNWRIARYDTEDYFAAHYDQADSLTVKTEDGGKERYDSSHTLLISLSDRSNFSGGATRLWPSNSYDDTAVDVELPRGYGLIFDQRLLHSGLAVRRGTKHIAQVGLLRGAPSAISGAPSTFRFGPGLDVR